MKYSAFKKYVKNEEVFTKEKVTKELDIVLDRVRINIAEHQFGNSINEPYVTIVIKNGIIYGMSLSTFLKKITN